MGIFTYLLAALFAPREAVNRKVAEERDQRGNSLYTQRLRDAIEATRRRESKSDD